MLARILVFRASASLVLLALAAPAAQASSSQAWEEFRRAVETACLEAAAPLIRSPRIVVDPFGSQSYGLAFLSGPAAEDGAQQSLICVYDKETRRVEVGGAMALERSVPAPSNGPAPSPGEPPARLLSPEPLAAPAQIAAPADGIEGPQIAAGALADLCDGPCPEALERLTLEDRADLLGLPAQIERAIAAGEGASLGQATAAAREAAIEATRAARGEENALSPLVTDLSGTVSCTLYYFGFEGEAARTVGTHQCRISEGLDGALLVEKTSGERLRALVEPLRGPLSAFLGRSFEAGAERQDYDPAVPRDDPTSELGNVVGFAARTADRVYLVSAQRRRFDPSDSFFWVLALDPS